MSRTATIDRKTKESEVFVELDLDGTGANTIDTGVPFFDHMLAQFSKHSGIDLVVRTKGDLHIDAHHTVEDTSLAVGQAINQALGDRAGLRRVLVEARLSRAKLRAAWRRVHGAEG